MISPSVVACREVFDENSQPSAEEISEYAQQLGIDPESESHLLPLAKEGLMQALPLPWKAYYDEKLQTHYYYNKETKKTQWEHPVDNVYKELVKKARDGSVQDDTIISVQELLTSEDNTKHLERMETKVASDEDDLYIDSDKSDIKGDSSALKSGKNNNRTGRTALAPLKKLNKKLNDLKNFKRTVDDSSREKSDMWNDVSNKVNIERPKMLFNQQSEIIDLKMHVLNSPEEENFNPILSLGKSDKGLSLTGKGTMFLKVSKSDFPSPDTDKSFPLDSVTKSDPPKGILREKMVDSMTRKSESVSFSTTKQRESFDEDKKSVRFKLENVPEPTISPSSNSSSEQNDGPRSIISAQTVPPTSPTLPPPNFIYSVPLSNFVSSLPMPISHSTSSHGVILSPITIPHAPSTFQEIPPSFLIRPSLHPKSFNPSSSRREEEKKTIDGPKKESVESGFHESLNNTSTGRRLLRPPATEYIKPDLFQKNFLKISDIVRPNDADKPSVNLDNNDHLEKEMRPRSPMMPQKNKISINLMESIESETSVESPDAEYANIDLNDLDDSEVKSLKTGRINLQDNKSDHCLHFKTSTNSVQNSQNEDPKSDLLSNSKLVHLNLDDSKISLKEEILKTSKTERDKEEIQVKSPILSLSSELKSNSCSDSIEKDKVPMKSSTSSHGSELKSPRGDFSRRWSNLSTFKPLNKAVVTPLKSSDSVGSLNKTNAKLDGVILSQGKSQSDNVVVVYQFESQEENSLKQIKSPLISDVGREMIERNKGDERRRLEITLQKELETIRIEWISKERKMKAELMGELKESENKFLREIKYKMDEQSERHHKEMEEALSKAECDHQKALQSVIAEFTERYKNDVEDIEKHHDEKMNTLKKEYQRKIEEEKRQLEIENERALSDLRDELHSSLQRERECIVEENKATIESLRQEHAARISDLKHDYRAEVENLRTQHACHLNELRAKLSHERAQHRHEGSRQSDELQEKYRALKEKYARLKHDVKMSIERRNKRREMSMTTGSETEKSNSNKATQSGERLKELNETSLSAVLECEPSVVHVNNNRAVKCNDNETSYSESNAQNNNEAWKHRRRNTAQSADTSDTSGLQTNRKSQKKIGVAFKEPLRRKRHKDKVVTSDCQDSSEATTTADEKSKDTTLNGLGRRRCFTRLKSASTSRLNYSPKRGEGWSSPLESLRQQLRKLDDLEDQLPDMACQPAYSLRYPFAELESLSTAETPELEFLRHRALVEREGMRRARAVLKKRKAALRETRASLSPHRAPSEEREVTELEVALHRARALLGEKEIRLSHIERALRRYSESPHLHRPPPLAQEELTSDASSEDVEEETEQVAVEGAVLRSLKALHADVRHIWRALDARSHTASPETSSCNAGSSSQQHNATLPAHDAVIHDNIEASVAERAKGLRAWLQTPP